MLNDRSRWCARPHSAAATLGTRAISGRSGTRETRRRLLHEREIRAEEQKELPMNLAARNAAFAVVLTALGAGAALSQTGTATTPGTTVPTTPGTTATPSQSSTAKPGSTLQPMVTMPNANAYAPQNGGATAGQPVMPNANPYTPSSTAAGSSVLPTQSGCPTVAGTNGCLSNPTATTPAASTPRPSPQGTLQPTACPNGQTPPPGQTSCPS
jgi:hypothetical protein